MGMGIVQVAAQVAKIPVTVMDASADQIKKQVKFMGAWLAEALLPAGSLRGRHSSLPMPRWASQGWGPEGGRLGEVDSLMEKNIQKGKMTQQERDEVHSRISTTTNLDDLANVDYVVEVSTTPRRELHWPLQSRINMMFTSSVLFATLVVAGIQAVSEKFELKRDIFQRLCKVTPPTTILSSNTSSISISKIAGVTDRREKVRRGQASLQRRHARL